MRREHQPYLTAEEKANQVMSFADGLRLMAQRGPIGPRVNLTKRRARAVEYLCSQMVYCVPEFDTPKDEDDYHAAIAWIHQQVQKRYSRFDLAG